MHETTRKSAEDVCDDKIAEWLMNRKKHAASRRKRTRSTARAPAWITKLNSRKKTLAQECNTPKRSTNSLRRGRSAGAIQEPNFCSPLAPSMTRKPTKPNKGKKKNKNRWCLLFVCFARFGYICLPCLCEL